MSSPYDLGTICLNVILKDLLFLASVKVGSKPNFVDRSFSSSGWFSALKRSVNGESRITCVHEVNQMVDQVREFVKLTSSINELAHILELLPKAIQGINNLGTTYADTTSVRTSLSTIALKMTKLIKTTERKIKKLETKRRQRKTMKHKKEERPPKIALARTSPRPISPGSAQYPGPRNSPVLVSLPEPRAPFEARPSNGTPATWIPRRKKISSA